jgi:predicted Zn-dependent protease
MTEKLTLQKIPDRTDDDILALLNAGKIADNPPYQSEFMSLLINKGPEAALTIFKAVRKKKPGHQLWGPGVVNSYGYELLNKKKTTEAVAVLELNTLAYADDPNSFDSLGEGYLRNGDRELAIKALKKSLSMNPPQNVRQNSTKLLKELGIDYEDEAMN